MLRAPEGKRVVLEIVRRLRQHLRQSADHKEAFRALDFNRDGVLDHAEVVRTLRLLLPDISNNELRYVLGRLYLADPDGDGVISLAEVRKLLEVSDEDLEALLDDIDRNAANRSANLPPMSSSMPPGRQAAGGGRMFGQSAAGGMFGNGAPAPSVGFAENNTTYGDGAADADPKVGGDYETGYGLVKVAEFLRAAAAREEKRLDENGIDAEKEQRNVQEDVLQKLEKLMKLMREQNRVEAFVRELGGTIAAVDAEAERLAAAVADAFMNFAEMLKQREAEMIASINAQKLDKVRVLQEQKVRSEKLGFDMRAAIELAEDALRDRDPASFLMKSSKFAEMIAAIELSGADVGTGPATTVSFSTTLDVSTMSERLRSALSFEEERFAAEALASAEASGESNNLNDSDPAVAVLRRVYNAAATVRGSVDGVPAPDLLEALRADPEGSTVVLMSAAENVMHSVGMALLQFTHFCALLGVGAASSEYTKQLRSEMERRLQASANNTQEAYWRQRAEAAEESLEKARRQHERAIDRLKADTEKKQREFETRLQTALERSEDLFAQQARTSVDGDSLSGPKGSRSPTSLGRRMPPSAGYGGAQARPMSASGARNSSGRLYMNRTSTRSSPSTGGESRLAMTGARMNVMH